MINSIEIFGTPTRRVMDPLHGSIPLFEYERKIIDHKLFQRLRYVVQNDVLFMVFPGAKHDRFLHSVGTMHMMSLLFKQIASAYFVGKKSITEEQRAGIKYLYACLRLAALLHDTGHSPFAHQFEHAKKIDEILSEPEIFENLWGGINYSKYYTKIPKHVTHEHFSVRVAYELLTGIEEQSGIGLQRDDVLFFMETTDDSNPSKMLLGHCIHFMKIFSSVEGLSQDASEKLSQKFLKFLASLISGELDADKMDYILRDSYFSGCRYGMFNKDHLIGSLRIGFEPFLDKNNHIHDVDFSLAIQEKGMGSLEDFIYARYQLYLELYNHRTVSGFRKLLSLAIDEVLSQEDINELKTKLTNLNLFADFTDMFFWERFRKHAIGKTNSACAYLINRKKLFYISERENDKEEQVKIAVERYESRFGKKVGYWKSHIRFSKINDSFDSIKVLTVEENKKRKLQKISSYTDFFAKFDAKDIYHLFEIPDFAE